jgi:hypothetical protein
MQLTFTPSAAKHRITQQDALYVIMHPTYTGKLPKNRPGTYIRLFIGFQHPQIAREIEVLVRVYESGFRNPEVFHVMFLSSKYDKYRRDNPDGFTDLAR